MNVVCIDNICYKYELTIGKLYKVIYIYPDGEYKIINDNGIEWRYYNNRFRSLTKSEIRNEKIYKLLADEVIE